MKLNVADYLKGFSIFTIVVMHLCNFYLDTTGILRTIIMFGGSGVHIFILCSGFGLYYSHLNRKMSFKNFINKRFSKVYIPYIIIIFISACFPFMYLHSDKIIAVLSHVFLFKMFFENYQVSFGGQFWFVSTIIQLYFLFYLLIKLKDKVGKRKFIAISLAISFFWWLIVIVFNKENVRIWNSCALQYLWEFSIGMVLAEKYYKDKEIKIPQKSILFLASVVGILITGITGYFGGAYKVLNDIPAMIGYGAFSLLLYSFNVSFFNNLFEKINYISYEWYLTHILVFSIIFNLPLSINKYLIGAIAMIASLIISWLYKISILHFRNFKSNFLLKKVSS